MIILLNYSCTNDDIEQYTTKLPVRNKVRAVQRSHKAKTKSTDKETKQKHALYRIVEVLLCALEV